MSVDMDDELSECPECGEQAVESEPFAMDCQWYCHACAAQED
jgi:ribosomal protein L37AE/L43A